MELTNEFRVGVPPATAWTVLTDVERIARILGIGRVRKLRGLRRGVANARRNQRALSVTSSSDSSLTNAQSVQFRRGANCFECSMHFSDKNFN